jgi:hypothetical protein
MHLYQLDGKLADLDFLSGKRIDVKAIMRLRQGEKPLETGDVLVVQLSNGKKYKGRVLDFIFFQIEDRLSGDLSIVKL